MNNELSLQARGALAYFRENPDVEITREEVERLGVSKNPALRILKELIASGHIMREDLPRKSNGDFGGIKYYLIKSWRSFDLQPCENGDTITP